MCCVNRALSLFGQRQRARSCPRTALTQQGEVQQAGWRMAVYERAAGHGVIMRQNQTP